MPDTSLTTAAPHGSTPAAQLRALLDQGLTFAEVRAAFAEHNTARDEAYIAHAREHIAEDGEIEIDEHTITAQSDGEGDYVLAWVWVSGGAIDFSGLSDDAKNNQPG